MVLLARLGCLRGADAEERGAVEGIWYAIGCRRGAGGASGDWELEMWVAWMLGPPGGGSEREERVVFVAESLGGCGVVPWWWLGAVILRGIA